LILGPETAVFDRAPFTASFRAGQFDFVLLTVHLSYTDHARRASEANALAALARRIVDGGAEKDLIVWAISTSSISAPNLPAFRATGLDAPESRRPRIFHPAKFTTNLLIDRRFTREWTGLAGTWPI